MHAPNGPQTLGTLSLTKNRLSTIKFLNKVKTNVCLAPFRAQWQRFRAAAPGAVYKIVIPRSVRSSCNSLIVTGRCSGYAYAALQGHISKTGRRGDGASSGRAQAKAKQRGEARQPENSGGLPGIVPGDRVRGAE